MGMFDFLKVTSKTGAAKPAAKAKPAAANTVEFDGKKFPLSTITTKGFVITGFDGSLITNQNARITVSVNDAQGKFTFATTVAITEAKDGTCAGAWTMLSPEVEDVIRKYAQLRKQAGR